MDVTMKDFMLTFFETRMCTGKVGRSHQAAWLRLLYTERSRASAQEAVWSMTLREYENAEPRHARSAAAMLEPRNANCASKQ